MLRAEQRFLPAQLGLARMLVAREQHEAALASLAASPLDAEAVEMRARLLLDLERPEEALADLARLERLATGTAPVLLLQAEALAALDPLGAKRRFEDWLGHPSVERLGAEGARVAVSVSDALRQEGEQELARQLLARLGETADAGEHEVLQARLDRYEVEEAARVLAQGGSELLNREARTALVRAREAMARGRTVEALADLQRLIESDSANAEVQVAWAQVQEASGNLVAAEEALVLAARLEPLEPRHVVQHARFLDEHYGGAAAIDTVLLLERAVRLRPGSGALWAELGRARWALGDLDGAARAYRLATERGAPSPEALARQEPPPARPEVMNPTANDQELALPLEVWVARVYLGAGRLKEAAMEVEQLREGGYDGPGLLEVEAALAVARGELPEAEALYRRAREQMSDDARLLVAHGDVLLLLGRTEQALQALEDAANLPGGGAAWLPLARQSADAGRPWEARERLGRFFAVATGAEVEQAQDLAARIDRDIRRRVALVGLGGGVGIMAPLMVAWFRRRGISTATFLARRPEASRDLAPVLAALRHEVLKHNASLLEPLAVALEQGDEELVSWGIERLFGEAGVIERFREHAARIEAIGHRYGEVLNLHRNDEVFAPALAALLRLERLQKALRGAPSPSVPDDLRACAAILNQQTYRGLGELLSQGARVLIDDELLVRAWDAVQAEPARRGTPTLALGVELVEHVAVQGARADLHDILVNLFRNALQAGATRVVVRSQVIEDWVTGLESVVIAVADDAPGRVTTAQIRSRFIDRGLGLVVDLAHRVGGSVSVIEEPGFAKAIALTLPRIEDPGGTP